MAQNHTAHPALAGWALCWRWAVATTTGELLGFAVPAAVGPLALRSLEGLPGAKRPRPGGA